ncbi:MAG: hypothetical protein QM527_13710 [Alphaproteobacteria bacterium]|nr:hypothetical protein [Alphaproteobacteria bacterium]
MTVAVRLGFGRSAVVPQKGFALGTKTKVSTGAVSKLSVFPDCVIESDGTRPRMLLDAKYKGHVEKGQLRITEADIYEALAFSQATGCNLIVLAYPAPPSDAPQPVGSCMVFEKAQVEEVRIIGVQIESRLISKAGALRTFSANLATGISGALL